MSFWQKVKQALAENEWGQGQYLKIENGKRCLCLFGAVCYVATDGRSATPSSLTLRVLDDETRAEVRGEISRRFEEATSALGISLVTWNDMPGRTLEEVNDLLDRLADAEVAA